MTRPCSATLRGTATIGGQNDSIVKEMRSVGKKFTRWQSRSEVTPENLSSLSNLLRSNRNFRAVQTLDYGDYGLVRAFETIHKALREGKRIALYADYDVDGTMSCVSWIWYLQAIGYSNFTHYIPCRFDEGYGLNMEAMRYLIDERGAELIITMDTGITANQEAAYCRERGVEFVCTDHHKIQPEKMPDCVILNPKLHPDAQYQELCGCGITFVLLRRLAKSFPVSAEVWNDILALTGMATICDVVPFNGVNHKLANLGVQALLKSQRPIFVQLRQACSLESALDEKDVGFRIGPRINAVGRLRHASAVVEAFLENNPEKLIRYMGECNEERKVIQKNIFAEADQKALQFSDDPILFLGGDWHPGVVGIAASKIAEKHWKPTWLFNMEGHICKGSARSIPGFDVTEAMQFAGDLFDKFGGHKAAGGYAFQHDRLETIRAKLLHYASDMLSKNSQIWESKITFDCHLPLPLLGMSLVDTLEQLRPFGHGFEEPLFLIEAEIDQVQFYRDKSTGEPRHTAVSIRNSEGKLHKIMYFNEVHDELKTYSQAQFLVSASRNYFRGQWSLSLMGQDWTV